MKLFYEVIKHLQRHLVSKPSTAASQAGCKFFLLQFWLINVKRTTSSLKSTLVRPGAAAGGPRVNWRTHPLETIKARPSSQYLQLSASDETLLFTVTQVQTDKNCMCLRVCALGFVMSRKHQIRIRQL